MDLEVVGRHVLLFDDDAQAAFVNSPSALVPWGGDASLVIDRYDARHLLPSIPAKRGVAYVELELDGLSRLDLDNDRYLDLLLNPEEGGAEGASKGEEADSGTHQAVPFLPADSNGYINDGRSDAYSGYHPSFPLPENLLSSMPSTEKLHQIIARTALFVVRHGGQSEIILRVKQGDNPTFGFLMPTHELHPYFRFLVEHPDLLNSDSSIKAQVENRSEMGDKQTQSAGGALSLLGSAYGSLDEDERTIQESLDAKESELDNPCCTLAPEQIQQSNKSAIKDPIPESEAKLLASSKESTQALKKNPPVVPSNSISACSKPKVQTNSGDTNASKAHPTTTEVEKMIVEPPSTMKETICKIIEFILRNGREFEAVLIEQDRSHGRFPFLLPTNLYHAYYLKFLHEAQEDKRLGKRSNDQKHDSQQSNDCGRKSRETSVSATRSSGSHSDGLYDPEQKGKFKMVIGGPKKDVREPSPKPCKEPGVSVDMAAAIVMAATRGFGAPPGVQLPAKPSPISSDAAAAIVMAATGASKSPTRDSANVSPPIRGHHTSSFESLSVLRNSSTSVQGETSPSAEGKCIDCADGMKAANAIAKNVAIAAASEADSSEASLTKEQKLKAERLKRAKLFTSMIKRGASESTKLLPAAVGQAGGQGIGCSPVLLDSKSDHSRKELEGSSTPIDVEVSGKLDERVSSDRGGNHHPSRNDNDVELEEHGHMRQKKHLSDTTQSDKERRHKRRYRSSSRSSRQESSSEDELPLRKRSSSGHHDHRRHHCTDDDDSDGKNSRCRHPDDDDKNRSRSHSHRRRKSRSEMKNVTAKELMETIMEQPDHTKSLGGTSEDAAPSSSVSDDLRAKVRAMLLATL